MDHDLLATQHFIPPPAWSRSWGQARLVSGKSSLGNLNVVTSAPPAEEQTTLPGKTRGGDERRNQAGGVE